jgi:hypothetical protein
MADTFAPNPEELEEREGREEPCRLSTAVLVTLSHSEVRSSA